MSMDDLNDKKYEIEIMGEDEENLQKNAVDSNHEDIKKSSSEEKANNIKDKSPNENKYLEQLQRLQAEFVNYKKRIDKERMELSNIFKSELISLRQQVSAWCGFNVLPRHRRFFLASGQSELTYSDEIACSAR